VSITRTIAFSMLGVLAVACAPRVTTRAQGPLKPKDGPSAALYVNYSGGLIDRRVSATFSVDRDAHVVVGHLGGDGVITLLYPETPRSTGMLRAGTKLRTEPFYATYDGMPSMLSYAVSPYRQTGALMDSYDGRGNGYVFIIASDRRLDFGAFDDGGDWEEIYVENFHATSDPRWGVRDFADRLARGGGYTLKFASGMHTQYVNAYASSAFDCSLLFTLGFSPYSSWYFFGAGSTWDRYYNVSAFRRSGFSYCGGNPWFMYDRIQRYGGRTYRGWVYPAYPRVPAPVSRPTVATTPTIEREGRRPLGDRSAFSPDSRTLTPELTPSPPATLADRPRRDVDRRRSAPSEENFVPAAPVRRALPVERRAADRPSEPRETRPSAPRKERAAPRPTTRSKGSSAPSRASRPTDRGAGSTTAKKPTPRPKPDDQR